MDDALRPAQSDLQPQRVHLHMAVDVRSVSRVMQATMATLFELHAVSRSSFRLCSA